MGEGEGGEGEGERGSEEVEGCGEVGGGRRGGGGGRGLCWGVWWLLVYGVVDGVGCGIQWLGEADQIELRKSGTA